MFSKYFYIFALCFLHVLGAVFPSMLTIVAPQFQVICWPPPRTSWAWSSRTRRCPELRWFRSLGPKCSAPKRTTRSFGKWPKSFPKIWPNCQKISDFDLFLWKVFAAFLQLREFPVLLYFNRNNIFALPLVHFLPTYPCFLALLGEQWSLLFWWNDWM